MDTNLLTYLACICFLFIFGRVFIVPIKKIMKLLINSIFGGVIIFLINNSHTSYFLCMGMK